MCDYSLMGVPNRLAVCGEDLVIRRFEAGSVGLASPCDIQNRQAYRKAPSHGFWPRLKEFFEPQAPPAVPAVCIPPGARLLIQDIPAQLQRECGFQEEAEEAVFTQVTADVNMFRDAIRFENGVEILLQRLNEGQRVRVLDLSSSEDRKPESMAHQRAIV
jgi:hypothetical protein